MYYEALEAPVASIRVGDALDLGPGGSPRDIVTAIAMGTKYATVTYDDAFKGRPSKERYPIGDDVTVYRAKKEAEDYRLEVLYELDRDMLRRTGGTETPEPKAVLRSRFEKALTDIDSNRFYESSFVENTFEALYAAQINAKVAQRAAFVIENTPENSFPYAEAALSIVAETVITSRPYTRRTSRSTSVISNFLEDVKDEVTTNWIDDVVRNYGATIIMTEALRIAKDRSNR